LYTISPTDTGQTNAKASAKTFIFNQREGVYHDSKCAEESSSFSFHCLGLIKGDDDTNKNNTFAKEETSTFGLNGLDC
jgi:hypothetical protein